MELPLVTIMLDLARPKARVLAVPSSRSNIFAFKVSGSDNKIFGVLTHKRSTTVGRILQVVPSSMSQRATGHTFKGRIPECTKVGANPTRNAPESPRGPARAPYISRYGGTADISGDARMEFTMGQEG